MEENPTASILIIKLVSEDIPLNTKQLLIVEQVLSAVLSWNGAAYDASKRANLLLHQNYIIESKQVITLN